VFVVDGKRKFELVGDGTGIVIIDERSFVNVIDESLLVVRFNDERVLFDDEFCLRFFENIIDDDNYENKKSNDCIYVSSQICIILYKNLLSR
jgi:hypothetical protein